MWGCVLDWRKYWGKPATRRVGAYYPYSLLSFLSVVFCFCSCFCARRSVSLLLFRASSPPILPFSTAICQPSTTLQLWMFDFVSLSLACPVSKRTIGQDAPPLKNKAVNHSPPMLQTTTFFFFLHAFECRACHWSHVSFFLYARGDRAWKLYPPCLVYLSRMYEHIDTTALETKQPFFVHVPLIFLFTNLYRYPSCPELSFFFFFVCWHCQPFSCLLSPFD